MTTPFLPHSDDKNGRERAIVGYFSAVHQGKVAASGVSVVAKKPEQQSKAMILSAMVETYAVLALLTSILLILNVKVG